MRSGSKPPGPRNPPAAHRQTVPAATPQQAPGAHQRPIRELSYEERIQALEDECASLRELVTKLVGTSVSTGALLRHEQLIGDLRRDVKQLQANEARRAVDPSKYDLARAHGVVGTAIDRVRARPDTPSQPFMVKVHPNLASGTTVAIADTDIQAGALLTVAVEKDPPK